MGGKLSFGLYCPRNNSRLFHFLGGLCGYCAAIYSPKQPNHHGKLFALP